MFSLILSRYEYRNERILSVEIESCHFLFLFYLVLIGQSVEYYQIFQQVISRHLNEEQKPVGTQDAAQ